MKVVNAYGTTTCNLWLMISANEEVLALLCARCVFLHADVMCFSFHCILVCMCVLYDGCVGLRVAIVFLLALDAWRMRDVFKNEVAVCMVQGLCR